MSRSRSQEAEVEARAMGRVEGWVVAAARAPGSGRAKAPVKALVKAKERGLSC
ncbi:MAG: hypothetical protein HYY08_00765 [Firmicutes bacterium]|nr:hypothetical protein [Bacillota bacterium]